MPIADTNPHSSMMDEDGNKRVAESILLGTVSEDGREHVEATSLLRGTARAISNVWPIPLRLLRCVLEGDWEMGLYKALECAEACWASKPLS